MKKVISTVVIGSMFFAGSAFAQENKETVSVGSELYETVRLLEVTQYDLTESLKEKALLQSEYAEKRLAELEEQLENGDQEAAEELLHSYEEHVEAVEENLAEAEENGEDVTDVTPVLEEDAANRTANLVALLEREDLPETAKAGISKAIENQKAAMEKAAAAKAKGKDQEENKEEEAEETAETEEVENEVAKKAKEKAAKKAEEAKEEAAKKLEEAKKKADEAKDNAPEEEEEAEETEEAESTESEEQGKENAASSENGQSSRP